MLSSQASSFVFLRRKQRYLVEIKMAAEGGNSGVESEDAFLEEHASKPIVYCPEVEEAIAKVR